MVGEGWVGLSSPWTDGCVSSVISDEATAVDRSYGPLCELGNQLSVVLSFLFPVTLAISQSWTYCYCDAPLDDEAATPQKYLRVVLLFLLKDQC